MLSIIFGRFPCKVIKESNIGATANSRRLGASVSVEKTHGESHSPVLNCHELLELCSGEQIHWIKSCGTYYGRYTRKLPWEFHHWHRERDIAPTVWISPLLKWHECKSDIGDTLIHLSDFFLYIRSVKELAQRISQPQQHDWSFPPD